LKLLFEIEEISMYSTKRGLFIASLLVLVAIMLSACEQPYSTPPAVTNTPLNPNSLFTTPMPGNPTSMSDLEKIATLTAMATLGTANPVIATATTNGTPNGTATIALIATQTATPMIGVGPTATATQAVPGGSTMPAATTSSNSVATSTPAPVGAKPGSYVLKEGEFPYCIARRFNVDPDQLLSANGMTEAQAESLSAGTTLVIPSGNAFPGDRSLHDHPATFIVGTTYPTNTVYGVACYYGDIDPSVIAQANGISTDATLTNGQSLSIP
jgi:LysM repeat protein